MKKYVFLLLASVLVSCASKEYYMFTSFHEPADAGLRYLYSKDGVHWDSIAGTWLKPEVGLQKVMRDPSIVRTPDGVYRLVWTSSWKGDRGFGYASSKDLVHWSPERFIPVMTDTTTVNVWAPELFWDDVRGEMMIIWASCIPYKFPKGIEDEHNNHRLYYTTTKDFVTFTPTRLFYDPGFSCIDATLVKRGNADYVMVVKDNTRNNRNIKVAFARDAHGPWSEASAPFTESFTEGPTVAKLARGYLIYYDRYHTADFGGMYTTDFRHFDDYTAKVSVPVLHKHGTIFKAPERLVKQLKTLSQSRKGE